MAEVPDIPPNLETLEEIQALLKTKAKEILFARAEAIPGLQLEIQKLRIVAALYKEISSNETNRDLYKEMNLLNRMTTGRDLEEEADRKNTEEAIEHASERLKDRYGVSVQSANRIARALGSVLSKGAGSLEEVDGDESEPEPIEPGK